MAFEDVSLSELMENVRKTRGEEQEPEFPEMDFFDEEAGVEAKVFPEVEIEACIQKTLQKPEYK